MSISALQGQVYDDSLDSKHNHYRSTIGEIVRYIHVLRTLSQQFSSLNWESFKKLLELKCGQK